MEPLIEMFSVKLSIWISIMDPRSETKCAIRGQITAKFSQYFRGGLTSNIPVNVWYI